MSLQVVNGREGQAGVVDRSRFQLRIPRPIRPPRFFRRWGGPAPRHQNCLPLSSWLAKERSGLQRRAEGKEMCICLS